MSNDREKILEVLELARKSNDTEDPIDRLFNDPLGMVWTNLCIKTHVSANTVTFISTFFGIIGGALFAPRNLLINLLGILLFTFSCILDSTDGQIARLTHTSSKLGRALDGISDGIRLAAAYLAIGVRLMGDNIPFTDRPWGLLIWPILLLTGAWINMGQNQLADYYRNAHLFFLRGAEHSEFGHTELILAERRALPQGAPLWEKCYLSSLLGWTRRQEKASPRIHRLMDLLQGESDVDPALRKAFVEKSRPYIQLTNVLTTNIRLIVLYVLVLVGQPFWFLPFTFLIMELIKGFMRRTYEGIAEELTLSFFPQENDKQ